MTTATNPANHFTANQDDDATRPRAALLAAIRALHPGLVEIRDDDSLTDLGLDSLDRVALLAVVEQATGRLASDRAFAEARTVADLLTCATSVIVPQPAPPPRPQLHATSRTPGADTAQLGRAGLGWIDPGGQVGAGTRLWHQAQVSAGARVGDDCTLGKSVFVGADSMIGDRVKIGNDAHLFGAIVADEVMICPGALLLEDPAPRATTLDGRRKGPGDFTRRPVTVHTGATIGAGAIITPGVTVGAHALVAVGAIVVRDVAAHALVAGNPARQCGWVCLCAVTVNDNHQCPDCGRRYTVHGDHLVPAHPEAADLREQMS